jgi:hypothetical protein
MGHRNFDIDDLQRLLCIGLEFLMIDKAQLNKHGSVTTTSSLNLIRLSNTDQGKNTFSILMTEGCLQTSALAITLNTMKISPIIYQMSVQFEKLPEDLDFAKIIFDAEISVNNQDRILTKSKVIYNGDLISTCSGIYSLKACSSIDSSSKLRIDV